MLDVGAGSFRNPKAVQSEQRDQRMLAWWPDLGSGGIAGLTLLSRH
jgi:hypothetical protein